MLDNKTGKFTEWPLPHWSGSYYETLGQERRIVDGGMTTDRAVRLDPKTGRTVGIPLAKGNQYSARVRGPFDGTRHVLDGQQPWGCGRQGGTAGLAAEVMGWMGWPIIEAESK